MPRPDGTATAGVPAQTFVPAPLRPTWPEAAGREEGDLNAGAMLTPCVAQCIAFGRYKGDDQRNPAKRSFSGTAAPVVSWTRTKVSTPISSVNLSLPIFRKKMFSPWLACAASASNF